MTQNIKRGLAVLLLGAGLALAAAATRTVEVLNADGRVIATGALSGHLTATGALNTGRTLRVTTTAGGVSKVQTFVLAAPITARDPEAERLGVRVGDRVLSLETALEGNEARGQEAKARRGADDGAGHDAGDDHGGGRGGSGSGGSGGGHGGGGGGSGRR